MSDMRVALTVANARLRDAVRAATLLKDEGRHRGMGELRDADGLRWLAADIKQHTLEHLDFYLSRFVDRVEAAGGVVHFAETGADARKIIARIARDNGLRRCVKAKSMTSEEIGLTPALETVGCAVVETDLGEWVVQIDGDRPSHIVTPIIHKDRASVARSICEHLDVPYTEDAQALTRLAREHLRDVFRQADLGVTGVNFAVAETGTLCICTNEGNGRFTATRPRVHVALMGIEKLVPRLADLSVFLKLLGRSATSQDMTVYTTLLTGPRRSGERDGPAQLHVVLLDGGRSEILGGDFREVLRCIRCGACLNACPVYRGVGGHAYGSVYAGPIGMVVSPLLRGLDAYHELPHASSLCGACFDACPVRIDLPRMLVELRQETNRAHLTSPWKRAAMRTVFATLGRPTLYRMAQRVMRFLLPGAPADEWSRVSDAWFGGAAGARDLPRPAGQSFRRLWAEELSDE